MSLISSELCYFGNTQVFEVNLQFLLFAINFCGWNILYYPSEGRNYSYYNVFLYWFFCLSSFFLIMVLIFLQYLEILGCHYGFLFPFLFVPFFFFFLVLPIKQVFSVIYGILIRREVKWGCLVLHLALICIFSKTTKFGSLKLTTLGLRDFLM